MLIPNTYSAFGDAAAELCRKEAFTMRAQGKTPTTKDMSAVIATLAEATFPPPKPKPLKETMDGIFDALMELDGCSASSMTKSESSRIGGVRKELLASIPNLTGDDIKRAAAKYRSLFRDQRLTAKALCSNWSKVHGGKKTVSETKDVYVEPSNWREHAYKISDRLIEMDWLDIPITIRADLLAKIP